MSKWPMVPLGEVLNKSAEQVTIQPDKTYREITVRLWGRGVVLRREASGGEIATSRRIVARRGQFIVSRIDARNGAFGLVPDHLDGAVVSNDFPVFDAVDNRLHPSYLNWLSKTSSFVDLCRAASEGTTNRVRLKENLFLKMQIPLPSLSEQHRLVEWIDGVARRVEEAKRLRAEADREVKALFAAQTYRVFQQLTAVYPVVDFGSFTPHVTSGPRNWGSRLTESGERFYRAQDILLRGKLAWNNKAFVAPPDSNQGAGARLQLGDLMIVITGATVGRAAVYPKGVEPGYVSQHVAICRFGSTQMIPRYALHGLLSPPGQEQLLGQRYGQGKPGLNLTNIRNLRLPMPPRSVQEKVIRYIDNLEYCCRNLSGEQLEAGSKLNAVIPSILNQAFNGEHQF